MAGFQQPVRRPPFFRKNCLICEIAQSIESINLFAILQSAYLCSINHPSHS